MPTRVSTFTNTTLVALMSAAAWNQWVDSWNTWLTFMGLSGASLLTHGSAGGTALPRASIALVQNNLSSLISSFLQDVAPVDTGSGNFWPTHTGATARAAAGLSGGSWTRQWFRRVANTTSGTAYLDGDTFVNGDLAWNMADGRVYLRGASSWTLQPRNTFPTVKTGEGAAQAYDIITSTIFNELAAVHQVLYYTGTPFNFTAFGFGWQDDGCKTGSSPSDFPPFTFGDTTATAAETDADAAWSTATPSTSGQNGTLGDGGPATYLQLAHLWTDATHDWWQGTHSTQPRKYGGNYASGGGVIARRTGASVELWARIIRPGTAGMPGTASPEYEGPYAEDSLQQIGSTHTIGAGETSAFLSVDLGSVSAWPTVTAHAYATQDSGRRGCVTSRTQVRTDLRPAIPAP